MSAASLANKCIRHLLRCLYIRLQCAWPLARQAAGSTNSAALLLLTIAIWCGCFMHLPYIHAYTTVIVASRLMRFWRVQLAARASSHTGKKGFAPGGLAPNQNWIRTWSRLVPLPSRITHSTALMLSKRTTSMKLNASVTKCLRFSTILAGPARRRPPLV